MYDAGKVQCVAIYYIKYSGKIQTNTILLSLLVHFVHYLKTKYYIYHAIVDVVVVFTYIIVNQNFNILLKDSGMSFSVVANNRA